MPLTDNPGLKQVPTATIRYSILVLLAKWWSDQNKINIAGSPTVLEKKYRLTVKPKNIRKISDKAVEAVITIEYTDPLAPSDSVVMH